MKLENYTKDLGNDYLTLKVSNDQETTEKMYKKYFINSEFKISAIEEEKEPLGEHNKKILHDMFGGIGEALNSFTISKN